MALGPQSWRKMPDKFFGGDYFEPCPGSKRTIVLDIAIQAIHIVYLYAYMHVFTLLLLLLLYVLFRYFVTFFYVVSTWSTT